MLPFGCVCSALKLHNDIFSGILHASLSYFDRTPTGRILSLFAKDIEDIDQKLPIMLGDSLYLFMEVIIIYSHNENNDKKPKIH